MNLEEQLTNAAEPWLDEASLSPARSADLAHTVRRRMKQKRLRRWLGSVAAAAAVAFGMLYWPVVVSVASDVPWVGPFIALQVQSGDRGAGWAQEQGYLVPVNKSATGQGYTFTVDSVFADAARTEVYYRVDGPDLSRHPRIEPTFNFLGPGGGYGGMSQLVDGHIEGQISLPPLPHTVALVSLTMMDPGDLKGEWNVSFLASRSQLDRLTRVIPVNVRWQEHDFDLTVQDVVLAPTETVINLTGTAPADFQADQWELLADEQPVQPHGWQGSTHQKGSGPPAVSYRIAFDRLEGNPQSLTFRISGGTQSLPGGPVLDLTKPGDRVTYGSTWWEFQSVQVRNGKTEVTLRTPSTLNLKQYVGRLEWVLSGPDGKTYKTYGMGGGPEESGQAMHVTISFDGEVPNPVRLEATRHVEPVATPFTATIPLH